MSIVLNQYPSGLRTLSGDYNPAVDLRMYRVTNVKDGDPAVVALTKQLQLTRLSNLSSTDKLAFIDCAKRLFGDFDAFVKYNIENNNLVHGHDLEFLLDTVEFVNGGVRSLSIDTWMSLLDQKPKKPNPSPAVPYVTLNYTGTNYIGKWLRQPNGMADLISTLIIMFGLKLTDPKNVKNGLI